MKKSIKRLLIAVIAAVVIMVVILSLVYANRKKDSTRTSVDDSVRRVSVVTRPIRQMVFEERIQISGNVVAKNTALVSARIPGTLDFIYVDEGDTVEAGKTRLFQTDRLILTKAVELATQQVDVAAAAVRAQEATLKRIEADLEKVQIDYDRYKRLYENDKAITKNILEVQGSCLKQVQAGVLEIKASIDLARSQRQQAKTSLTIARKDLSDSLVVSPISGKVSRRMLEPGEMAEPGTPVLHVHDLSVLEVSVYLPGEYYARINPGKTNMHVRVGAMDLGQYPVSYKSPTIASKLRTFEVKCLIKHPPAGVAPGLLARVVIVLDRREGLGVPSESIQKRAGEHVIFLVENDAARMVSVQPGLQTDGWTEIRAADLQAGASVVSLGQYYLNDGTPVSLVKEVR